MGETEGEGRNIGLGDREGISVWGIGVWIVGLFSDSPYWMDQESYLVPKISNPPPRHPTPCEETLFHTFLPPAPLSPPFP